MEASLPPFASGDYLHKNEAVAKRSSGRPLTRSERTISANFCFHFYLNRTVGNSRGRDISAEGSADPESAARVVDRGRSDPDDSMFSLHVCAIVCERFPVRSMMANTSLP